MEGFMVSNEYVVDIGICFLKTVFKEDIKMELKK